MRFYTAVIHWLCESRCAFRSATDTHLLSAYQHCQCGLSLRIDLSKEDETIFSFPLSSGGLSTENHTSTQSRRNCTEFPARQATLLWITTVFLATKMLHHFSLCPQDAPIHWLQRTDYNAALKWSHPDPFSYKWGRLSIANNSLEQCQFKKKNYILQFTNGSFTISSIFFYRWSCYITRLTESKD